MITVLRPERLRWRRAGCGSGPWSPGPARPGRLRQRTVAAGGIRSFGAQYVHDVANAFAEPAVTVHAYSPPLTAMRRYELTESGLVHTATARAEQDW